jgi:Zn-finger nucleic acid-binding protein
MQDQLLPMYCPYCDLHPRMDKAEHPRDAKVIMDVCEHCSGIWLDGGELEAIQKESWWSAVMGLLGRMSGG